MLERAKSEGTILASAVVVFGVWAFRSLYESGKTVEKAAREGGVKELVGLSPQPAHPAQFLVGFGFVFFTLSVVAVAAPKAAANFSLLVAAGTTVANGMSIFTDISKATAGVTNESAPTTELLHNPGKTEHQVARSQAKPNG